MEVKTILTEAVNNCQLLINAVNDHAAKCASESSNQTSEPPVCDLNAFWQALNQAAKAMSHEATKLAILFGSPPFPDSAGVRSMSGSLFNTASHFAGSYLSLPRTAGLVLHKKLSAEISSTLNHVKSFLKTISLAAHNRAEPQTCLEATGKLWEFCDKIPKLPSDNKQAVSRALKAEEALITDAYNELEEMNSSDEDEDFEEMNASLSKRSLELIPPISGLVKTCIGFFKRSHKLLETSINLENSKLDAFCEKMTGLSPLVDDLASSLYPPLDIPAVLEHTNALKAALLSAVEAVKPLASENDQKWVEVLVKAVEHNAEAVHSKVSSA